MVERLTKDPVANANPNGYRVVPFPPGQHMAVDWHSVMTRQHNIHALLEFDVTETRRAIHLFRRTSGRPLSFTALLVASFAHAIGEDPALQAYRRGKGRVVLFDDVDVAVLVEQVINGDRVPVPHLVRAANRKTPTEVDREIRAAQTEGDPYGRARRFLPLWLALPAVIRGVGRKPGLGRGGRVEAREVVCLTISVDHDVVNGAPVARFISRLRESIETAALLGSD